VAVDLFSGIGGMSVGLRQAGFDVVLGVEIDARAAATYGANLPDVPVIVEDIRTVDASRIREHAGLNEHATIDLLAGCPPCQGFSTLRTRNRASSVNDPRNDLLNEFRRLVDELEPIHVMMENVPRLAEEESFRDFVGHLTKNGYHVAHGVLDASWYGVPQRRRRLILTASRSGQVSLPEPDAQQCTVRQALETLPQAGVSGDPAHDHGERRSGAVRELIRLIPEDGGSRSELPPDRVLDCHKSFTGFSDVYGRMAWDKPAPTITSGCVNPSKGRFLHPVEHRSITLREAAILQGFPRTFILDVGHGKEACATQIGNALPPEFIRRQALRFLEAR
jgi:DNA (cytosine-5)-methyltransferase 1